MSTEISSDSLFLSDLRIEGFRGINELRIPKLGRVTLLAGDNGVGKTSVLEAVHVYATKGFASDLPRILFKHDEFISSLDLDGDKIFTSDPTALFFGRQAQENSTIKIGPLSGSVDDLVQIVWAVPTRQQKIFTDNGFNGKGADYSELTMQISYDSLSINVPWILEFDDKHDKNYHFKRLKNYEVDEEDEIKHPWPEVIEFQMLGPELVSNSKLQEMWKVIALTDVEDQVTSAMQMVLPETIQRIGIGLGDKTPFGNEGGIVVRFKGQVNRVPLRSLGDGAVRSFGVALALVTTHNGFVAIDEVENGIHYSHHYDFWKIIFKLAEENNIQVLATTHSFDCMKGFAQASCDFENSEGVLIRLEREEDRILAVTYPEDELIVAAEQGIEVR